MAYTIRLVQSLSEEERRQIYGLDDDPFAVARYKLSWRPKEWHLILEVDGEPVSHVGVLRTVVSVAGSPLAVGGIGGVITAEQARGKGYAQHLLSAAAALLRRELRVEFGLLFCRDELLPFYTAQGWQRLTPPVTIEQPDGKRPAPLNVLVLAIAERPWPSGPVDLQSLPW